MPLTPFHLGPALIAKGLSRRHFSLGTFALVQFVLDTEVVWNVLRGRSVVHTNLHTLLGATVIATLATLCWRPLSWVNQMIARRLARAPARDAPEIAEFGPVTWTGALMGAGLGVLLHVPLDAMMHGDMKPFAPWSTANPLYIPTSFEWLHLACLIAGVLGYWMWLRRVRRSSVAS
jgi:hypothetical protein